MSIFTASPDPVTPPEPAGSREAGGPDTAGAQAAASPRRPWWRELPLLAVVALALAVLVKMFLVQAFFIPSGSMETTLHGCPGCQGDRVLVNKVVYHVRGIHRGDIVVFDGRNTDFPDESTAQPAGAFSRVVSKVSAELGLGSSGSNDFIKRVIGLPGDRVACCSNGHVTVQPPGAPAPIELHEPYLYEDDHRVFCEAGTEAACPPGAPGVLIAAGQLWVMGDHRGFSADSRSHGSIPISNVVGRAFMIVYPFKHIGMLEAPDTSSR